MTVEDPTRAYALYRQHALDLIEQCEAVIAAIESNVVIELLAEWNPTLQLYRNALNQRELAAELAGRVTSSLQERRSACSFAYAALVSLEAVRSSVEEASSPPGEPRHVQPMFPHATQYPAVVHPPVSAMATVDRPIQGVTSVGCGVVALVLVAVLAALRLAAG